MFLLFLTLCYGGGTVLALAHSSGRWHAVCGYGALFLASGAATLLLLPTLKGCRERRTRLSWIFVLCGMCVCTLVTASWLLGVALLRVRVPTTLATLLLLCAITPFLLALYLRPGSLSRGFMGWVAHGSDLLLLVVAAGLGLLFRLLPAGYPFFGGGMLTKMAVWGVPLLLLFGVLTVQIFCARHLTGVAARGQALVLAGAALLLIGLAGMMPLWSLHPGVVAWWYVAPFAMGILLYAAAARDERDYPRDDPPVAGLDAWPSPTTLLLPAVAVLLLVPMLLQAGTPAKMLVAGVVVTRLQALPCILVLLGVRVVTAVLDHSCSFAGLHRRFLASEHLVYTDSLTGLANQRRFLERLDAEVQRSIRYRRPFALLFTDIDFFKLVNDVHGHRAGDVALRSVAHCLQQAVRTTDFVARYGGEEFVLLLPETTLAQAGILAERLRYAVEILPISLPDGKRLKVTISLGIAACPETSDTCESLLTAADDAMNCAKDTGRNRVVSAHAKQHLYVFE